MDNNGMANNGTEEMTHPSGHNDDYTPTNSEANGLAMSHEDMARRIMEVSKAVSDLATLIAQTQKQDLPSKENLQEERKSPTPQPHPAQRVRPIVADPPVFNGDRDKYMNWRSLLRVKVAVDHDAIGRGNIARYIYSRLGGKALEHARPRMENIISGAMDEEELISHLDSRFIDHFEIQRAKQSLNKLKQGNMSFTEFLSKYESLADLARTVTQDDDTRIDHLESKLNDDFGVAVSLAIRRFTSNGNGIRNLTYQEYVKAVQSLELDLKGREIARGKDNAGNTGIKTIFGGVVQNGARRSNNTTVAPPQRMVSENTNRSHDVDAMEVDPPGPVINSSTARGPRARWVSREELDARKRQGCCLRCGNTGHRIRQCPYAPAAQPNHARVNIVEMQPEKLLAENQAVSNEEQEN
jgi:hypothetical protein